MGLNALIDFCKENSIEYKLNEPMSRHTSFKIGGGAEIFISVSSALELSALFKRCKELNIPRFIIGKGTNLLVSDLGIEGAVISLAGLNGITVNGDTITCGAGAALSEAVSTISASVMLLRSSIGIYGVVALAAIFLPTLTELLLWRATLMITSSAASLFSLEKISGILKAVDTMLSVLVGILLLVAGMFIISLTVVITAGRAQ